MKDVTTLVIEAQDARSRMQEAKKRVKAEVRRKYEARMNLEIAEASQDAEIEFARTLARVHESGVSQAVLRREVLRTNVWSVWTYWRDLANIEPERVTIANAREERLLADRVFRWEVCEDNEIGYAIVLMKDAEGKKLDEEVWFTYITEKEGVLSVWPDRENPVHVDLWNERWNKEPLKLKRFLSDLANENRKEIS